MSVDYELYQIQRELLSIINELDSISNGVRRDFDGIGNEHCASAISDVASQYRYVRQRIKNIDTTKVFGSTSSGGGGGHMRGV